MVTQDQWVLGAVKGFAIPFTNGPHQPYPPRILEHSAEEELALQEEVESMLAKQAIKQTTPSGQGFSYQRKTVARGGNNLKALYPFVHTEYFKMDGINVVRDLLKAGNWMVEVDLKDTYIMLPIHEDDRAFLKFSLKDHTYQFRCLSFGLVCAPWAFTKTLRPLAAQLRQLGV